MEIPDHFPCLLRNLYAGQEAIVRTGHGIRDCFQIGKGVHQVCILSPCLFNLPYLVWYKFRLQYGNHITLALLHHITHITLALLHS